MHDRLRFDDFIVVLPGIGGSTLHRGDQAVWKPPLALGGALKRRGRGFEDLAGDHDLLDDPEYGDGVVASGLIGGGRSLPGLTKVNQYNRMRERITQGLDVVEGDCAVDGTPANYFEFPYDWRRDNRVSAQRLKQFIDRELPKWATTLPYGRPKIVFVCHSMGGLVAKYYLSALGGWEHCRALITFGTPFRGSLAALDLLANGVRKLGIDFNAASSVLREFTSVHQLLPRYPVVVDRRAGTPGPERAVRVHELAGAVGLLDLKRAAAAYEDFHRRMDEDRSTHAGKSLASLVSMVPVVGYGHSTGQSAVIDRQGLRTTDGTVALDASKQWLATGDGTVPALSAVPVELSETGTWAWENATHSSMHSTTTVLDRLIKALALYSTGLGDLQGPEQGIGPSSFAAGPDSRALDLRVNEVYTQDEPVVVTCASTDIAAGTHPPQLTISGPATPAEVVLDEHDGAARWTAVGLSPGSYEVTAAVGDRSVIDVFEVW
ncbi:lipase family alpha/beta hydrolase [Streptomyces galilaeus]|uniref:lipase family alpha/beta hydrolase n=1 Tax=Streptomyces galilaeus TaxID=33899 RepID=UPI0038F63BF6